MILGTESLKKEAKMKYIKGNLLNTDCPLILHGCNAQGKMRSGVAKLIRQEFPLAYEEYMTQYELYGLPLGTAQFVDVGNGKFIGNLITQKYYGYDGKKYVSYDAIHLAIKSASEFAKLKGFQSMAMPKVGAGLGGGSWDVIEAIIRDCSEVPVIVYGLGE